MVVRQGFIILTDRGTYLFDYLLSLEYLVVTKPLGDNIRISSVKNYFKLLCTNKTHNLFHIRNRLCVFIISLFVPLKETR